MTAAYAAALALTVAASFALALVLARRAGPVPGLRPLVLFIAGVGVWTSGPLLLALAGARFAGPALALIGLAALPAALYLHFALRFTGPPAGPALPRPAGWGYAAAGAATVLGYLLGIGRVEPWRGFEAMFVPGWGGVVMIAAGGLVGAVAHLVLALALARSAPLQRRQLAIVLGAAVWGFLSCTGFLFPALGLEAPPWPVLLLPAYTVAVAYGVLRYRLMAVNVWARRALTWALLVLVLGSGLAGLGALAAGLGLVGPLGLTPWQLWAILAAVLLAALLLAGPLRRLADRLVFPGGQVEPALAAAWQGQLAAARDWAELEAVAAELLRAHFREPVAVTVAPEALGVDPGAGRDPGGPALRCGLGPDGWRCALAQWDEAPPGPRQAALLFAGLLRDAADRLHQARRLAAAAEERRREAHLAELGALAATIAHDLRNPLNIVAMAAAGAEPALRDEIRTQLGRMDHLIADLLDYASAWKVRPQPLDLRETVEAAALGLTAGPNGLALDLAVPPGLTLQADPARLRRVFANLLANARAAARPGEPARARVAAERLPDGSTRIALCDAGAGVPEEIRDSLFQPFVSRSADGTGLGLAIVARIVEAHGGRAALAAPPPGWSTCFQLTFPNPEPRHA
ncbi:MAG TPA: HAMP domain-containing sensor histidine kinase [Alphaproteobacteria bacterium]|nr:HAMP domain-containing sensor histidine kinase [Alphaproteobacteria bacterium]